MKVLNFVCLEVCDCILSFHPGFALPGVQWIYPAMGEVTLIVYFSLWSGSHLLNGQKERRAKMVSWWMWLSAALDLVFLLATGVVWPSTSLLWRVLWILAHPATGMYSCFSEPGMVCRNQGNDLLGFLWLHTMSALCWVWKWSWELPCGLQ